MLAVLLLALVAAATADTTLQVNGREFRVFSAATRYTSAKAACEAQGTVLATICSEEELNALRATGHRARVTTEYWIGLPSSLPHHRHINVDQFSSIVSGSNCRILSNWANRPWSVYTKRCTDGNKPYICETGEVSDRCPVLPDPTEPPAPIVDPTEPAAPIIDPTEPPAPIVDPTEPPAPIVDPTEPPAPIVDPTEPLNCPKEREAFKANGLSVEPEFEGNSCKYLAKQCNEEKCFCVHPKKGERKFGELEVPLGQDFDCSKNAKKCHKLRFAALLSGQSVDFIPECTKAGKYAAKQCNASGACWCVKPSGKMIKGTKKSDGDAVTC